MNHATVGLVCALIAGCSSTTASSPTGSNASATQIDACKHAGCDKMKFFGCNSAEEQAACYSDCDKAAAGQIEVFTACAENSVCDPSCRTNIVPKPTGGSSGGAGASGGTSGGGASSSSCGTACDKLVACSFIRVGDKSACAAKCQTEAYQYQIDCVNSTACDKMKSACGDPTGGASGENTGSGTFDAGSDDGFAIGSCQSACDSLNFFSCIDAAAHQACRDRCSTAPANERESFTACANGAGGDCSHATDCYGAFRR
jgi:hypothetical protein